MKKVGIIILQVMCFLLTACASQQQFGGNAEYAEKTQHESPRETGVRYLLGRGVQQDNATAFRYFLKAARNDDALAQNEVAYLYAAGKGTEQNYDKAFIYYQKAAQHGLASAQYNLGLLYQHGLGTAPDQTMAVKWFRDSAAHGFEPARRVLADIDKPSVA